MVKIEYISVPNTKLFYSIIDEKAVLERFDDSDYDYYACISIEHWLMNGLKAMEDRSGKLKKNMTTLYSGPVLFLSRFSKIDYESKTISIIGEYDKYDKDDDSYIYFETGKHEHIDDAICNCFDSYSFDIEYDICGAINQLTEMYEITWQKKSLFDNNKKY
jgi:hypothetical protein